MIAEWFFNHPALRYGGYILFALVIFIPLSLKLEKYNNSIDEVKKKTTILLIILICIFTTRNYLRISKEIKIYNYQPIIKSFYYLDDSHFRIQKKFNVLIKNLNQCELQNTKCDLKNLKKIKEIYPQRYMFIYD